MNKGSTAITKRTVYDEDWKTAIAKNKKPIPKGEIVNVVGNLQNLYGDFVIVMYDGVRYSVKERDLQEVIK